MTHRVQLGLGFQPLLFLVALAQQPASGIERLAVAADLHAAKGDVEVAIGGVQWAHEATIVQPLAVFVLKNEVEGLLLGQSADGGSGVECREQAAQGHRWGQGEMEVAAQMDQVGCANGARPFFAIVYAQRLQAVGNIGGHIALLLDVLGRPAHVLAFAAQLLALQAHRSGQRHRVKVVAASVEQHLGCGREPHLAVGHGNKGHKHSRIKAAGAMEKADGLAEGVGREDGFGSREHDFAEAAFRQLLVETQEILMIVLAVGLPLQYGGKSVLRASIVGHLVHGIRLDEDDGRLGRHLEGNDYEAPAAVQLVERMKKAGLLRVLHDLYIMVGMRQTVESKQLVGRLGHAYFFFCLMI